ncbi:hypothetical protein GGI25_001500 [Coemansia spiralis]|uniref:AD domain-containing protein n=2 Tax=Coemansia TaxID=4863 RepID=A0A9W8GAQ4_9FUNG|nr:hypothetical protein EDC05_001647 [Coemansia umbellata]KAJ2624240.1 hypothetical protein GGI26_001596 [Coemansia sp. RSA 1358]KAJ2679365.1 hypothetical protein GGI25_001500 [Coemansia spiralis]
MNYLAAATRKPKESPGSKGANDNSATANSQKTATIGTTTGAPATASPATDANKMKSNATGNRSVVNNNSTNNNANADNNNNSNNENGKNTASGSSVIQPLSYAATAASKKPMTAAAATPSANSSANANSAAGISRENGAVARRPAGTRSSAPPSLPLTSLIDSRIRVKLVDGKIIEGLLFTYDVYSGVAALVSPAKNSEASDLQVVSGASPNVGGGLRQQTQVDLIKADNISDVEVIAKPGASRGGENDDEFAMPEIKPIPTSIIEARKQKSLIQAQERALRIGVGVSDKAQMIFEALSRTLPCRWNQEKIIVLDEVSIEPPYSVEDCCNLTEASVSLQRVKKVLQGELNRLEQVTVASAK